MWKLIECLSNQHKLEYEEYVQLLYSWSELDQERLFARAREIVEHIYGTDVYLRGLIEISNICHNDCFYCGIRKSNTNAVRYRLNHDTILECCFKGYKQGFRTFVLQGGEDSWFTDERVCRLIIDIKRQCPDAAITLSLGEKSKESYAAYRHAGADRYLLRHETADSNHYSALHPAVMSFEARHQCLHDLRENGFQVGAGFMVGSPGQTFESLAKDLLFLQEFHPHMVGIGPFLPHHDTPFAHHPAGSTDLTIFLLALVRLILPEALLPATTALGTADQHGLERGILAGANVIMPNLTPSDEGAHYLLYDGKKIGSSDQLEQLDARMQSINRNISMKRGDYIFYPH